MEARIEKIETEMLELQRFRRHANDALDALRRGQTRLQSDMLEVKGSLAAMDNRLHGIEDDMTRVLDRVSQIDAKLDDRHNAVMAAIADLKSGS